MMNAELPGEVLDEFADTYSTTFNGDYSTIPAEMAAPALARLVELGYSVHEDPRVLDLFREV